MGQERFSFIVSRGSGGTGNAAGLVFRARSTAPDGEVERHWFMYLTPHAVSPSNVASLLALLMVDEAVEVLRPIVFPPSPGAGILTDDGELVERTGPLPDATHKEVQRIAGQLTRDHSAYVDALVQWMTGQGVEGFSPVPKDHPLFRGPTGKPPQPHSFAPHPPDIPVHGRWQDHRRGDGTEGQ